MMRRTLIDSTHRVRHIGLDIDVPILATARIEADVLLRFAGERADESVFRGSHDDPPSGTGSTHASIPPRCVAM